MNCLLTGATGFVGGHLIDRLLNEGHAVNYLGRRRSGKLDERAAFHHWDPEKEPPLDSVPRLDAVFNLAGEPVAQRWTADVKRRIYTSRVEGTQKLVSAIGRLKYKPSVLVSASAVGYYGDRGDDVLTESSGPGQGFLSDVCVAWEREALRAREFGVRVVLLRIAMVLGRNGGALKQMLIPFRLGLGGNFGNGRQWAPWIHLDDLIALFVFAAEEESAEGALNASAPEPVPNARFTKALGRVIHRPTILNAPRFALHMALGELSSFLLASERVVPEATERAGFQFQHGRIEAALRSLLA